MAIGGGPPMLVLDSSYLVARASPNDIHRDRALTIDDRFMRGEWRELVLLDWVFAEAMTVLAARAGKQTALDWGTRLRGGTEIRWLHAMDIIDDIWEEYSRYPDQASLVDAAILATARKHGTNDIATFDTWFSTVPWANRVP